MDAKASPEAVLASMPIINASAETGASPYNKWQQQCHAGQPAHAWQDSDDEPTKIPIARKVNC